MPHPQVGMPLSPSLSSPQAPGKARRGTFLLQRGVLHQPSSSIGPASSRGCKARWEEGLSTWRCGAETSAPPASLQSHRHCTQPPVRPRPHARGMSAGKQRGCNLHSPVFDVGIKANPQPGKLRGHLSAPMISPMAGLSVMVRLVLLPGAQGYRWDERLG